MEFKGTKGKWELSENGGVYVTSNIGMICDLVTSSKEDKANALLISKAPEMLEMLKKCKIMCDHLNIHHVSNELNALIKEATEL